MMDVVEGPISLETQIIGITWNYELEMVQSPP